MGFLFAIAACASIPQRAAAPRAPLNIHIPSDTDQASTVRLDETTGAIHLSVQQERFPGAPLRQRIEVSESLVTAANARLKAELTDIPISIPARRIEGSIWELELPPNLLKLLSKDSRVKYSGTLTLDALGNMIPLTLSLVPKGSGKRPARSAG